ncbi:baseplate J/gp47 family protein [Oscillibacter sp.]|uniref:baseplate J/gp47 family protein n=1 Tax=Oscillibacter sp. TaxID=1945593 RepID=UPI00262D1DA1|nr:baseplate J/gp47 family protein [Oscillibacter sp.]MDD3346818.1 baseplate J/gp47 family protein [Oscillibacter sp.]
MKSIEEIYQELKDAFAERAGFDPDDGCDLAVRLWAAAAQIQALGVQADWVLDQSFPQTAEGVYLDRHAAMRGITRMPAVQAVGALRFSVKVAPTEALHIPAGTVCMSADEGRFQTTQEAVIASGALYADASAEALEGGSGGNAIAGAVSILTACPMAVTGCTNPAAFTGGSNEEDDESLRRRILESYLRLPNGANAAWYETTAMAHTGVAAARAVGRARGIGTVDVYITTESGLPGEELLAEVTAALSQKREIAVNVQVKAPTTSAVNVEVALAAEKNTEFATVKAAAEQAILGFFNGRLLGMPVRLAELGSRLYALKGVENYRISQPAADLAASDTVLPVIGTLTVTELEE